MATSLTRVSESPAQAVYCYKTGALTVGKNSFVLKGVPQGFVPNPDNFTIVPRTTSSGQTAAAGYASIDQASLIVDPTDATQILVDVYASSSIKEAMIYMS